jgi:parvulin-like peptidyl-prolyl isomerase
MNKTDRLGQKAAGRGVTLFLRCITPVLLLLWCSAAQGQIIDGIVAVVDEKVIMHSDLVKKMHELGAQKYEITVARQVLQVMVEDVVVDKLYRTMGLPRIDIKQAEEVAKGMNLDIISAQSVIKRNSLMEMMVKSRVVITQTMIQDYYDTNKEYAGSDSVHLKQILIRKDSTRADKAIKDLRSGIPFDEAAKAYSDILSGDSPDIGWIALNDLAGEARTALSAAKKGDIVGPIALGDNILIYQVLDRGLSGARPLEEVHDEIVEPLKDKYRREAFEHWLKMIMADHYISIYM